MFPTFLKTPHRTFAVCNSGHMLMHCSKDLIIPLIKANQHSNLLKTVISDFLLCSLGCYQSSLWHTLRVLLLPAWAVMGRRRSLLSSRARQRQDLLPPLFTWKRGCSRASPGGREQILRGWRLPKLQCSMRRIQGCKDDSIQATVQESWAEERRARRLFSTSSMGQTSVFATYLPVPDVLHIMIQQ